MENPYIKTHESYGRQESYLDVAAFAEDLRLKLGGNVIEQANDDTGWSCWSRRFAMPDGLEVYVRRAKSYGRDGKVQVSTGAPRDVAAVVSHYAMPKFPSIGLDSGRDLDTIAKAVKRRAIEPSAEPLAKARQLYAETCGRKSDLQAQIANLQARFPTVRVRISDGGEQADISYYSDAMYLSGTLYPDGSISPQRVGTIKADRVAAVLSVLLA